MQKKWVALSGIIILIVIIIAFIFIHNSATDKTDSTKHNSNSPIDLRPAIIAKLQSLVKTGSDGLYDLSINEIEPDILSSSVNVIGAKLTPNTQALKLLDSLKKAPDDIFTISLDSLRITGINLDDLLHTSHIQLDSIFISKPVIICDHQPKEYNRLQRENDHRKTLYQKLNGQIKSVDIQSIIIQKCTYTGRQKNKTDKIFNDVTMRFNNLLIDSSTQFDRQRIFFSKKVNISCNNFISRTADSLYLFKIGSVEIDATDQSLMAKQVAFVPRGTKQQFEKKIKYQDNRFDMVFPKVVAKNIDWWALTNNESLVCDDVQLYNAVIKDYIDRRLPTSDSMNNIEDFPHQLIMEVPIKININKLRLNDCDVSYEEFNPSANRSGTVTFNNLNGTISHISNIPVVMQKYQHTTATVTGLFMDAVSFNSDFSFDLIKYKKGNFSMRMSIATVNKDVINPIAEPLGLFTMKTGTVTKAETKIEGDNYTSNVELKMLYNDLHLSTFKKESDGDTTRHKKPLIDFLANTVFIKNANPVQNNDPRIAHVNVKRNPSQAFFGFIWKGMLTGILETVGLPKKYAGKR